MTPHNAQGMLEVMHERANVYAPPLFGAAPLELKLAQLAVHGHIDAVFLQDNLPPTSCILLHKHTFSQNCPAAILETR